MCIFLRNTIISSSLHTDMFWPAAIFHHFSWWLNYTLLLCHQNVLHWPLVYKLKNMFYVLLYFLHSGRFQFLIRLLHQQCSLVHKCREADSRFPISYFQYFTVECTCSFILVTAAGLLCIFRLCNCIIVEINGSKVQLYLKLALF